MRKTDGERIEELDSLIEQTQNRLEKLQKRLSEYKNERAILLSHIVIGQMEEKNLNYPEVESLIADLASLKQAVASQKPVMEDAEEIQIKPNTDLKVRVTPKEKAKIYANMKRANYSSFNSYAKKLLLDGYLIQWTSPETKELRRELGAVNRSLNQLVKRANTTGSIYAGDFLDLLNSWQTIQKQTLHYLNEMSRKTNGNR